MTKIAVIQTAFPGDVILSTAIFEALRDKESSIEITAVVRPESVCLINSNPYINKIIPYDKYGADRGIKGLYKIASELRGYDRAIIIQRHLRSTLIPFLTKIPERIGYDISSASFLFTKKIKYRQEKHEVQRCLDLQGIDDPSLRYKPKIYFDELTLSRVDRLLKDNGITSDFMVVAPGSAWETKQYPHYPTAIQLLYHQYQLPVVLVGGRDDLPLLKSISEKASHKPINLAGQTNLIESAAVISRANLVISNDSAPAHIAAAVGTPVIAIFGPTSPSFGFTPYSEKSAVIEIGKLYCRPCTSHGSHRCPERHFECMNNLNPEKIIEAANSLLGR